MDTISHLVLGFEVATSLTNLTYCFLGVLLGTAVGVLPGLGPIATISMLLPFTYGLEADTALIMLAGIFYGSQYGGSTTAILVNLPGEASSIVTTLDGHAMAKQGRAGQALAAAAVGSFFAGTVGTLFISLLAPPLAVMALQFGPAEYFSLILLGFVASIVLASGSLLRAIGMILLGLLLGFVGVDVSSGAARFTFGNINLLDGVNFVVVATGVFGIGEVLASLDNELGRPAAIASVKSKFLTREDWRRISWPIVRGTGLGAVLGVLPGAGALLASFSSYALEKRISPNADQFGHGAIEGVAAPEAANNASAQTAFIPTLTLGLPGSATMALMLGALIIQGIQPGPNIISEQPGLFWGLIVSMWIGNLMLLVLNLPLVGMWARMITIPYQYLFPVICVFCAIGAFSLSNNTFDVLAMALFGFLGYVFRKLHLEPAPMLLALILGPLMEEYLRRAMLLSQGDPMVFITSPTSLIILVAAAGLLASVLSSSFRKVREEALVEED
ncbi:tripartite tricarboxylate transporter permease [Mesorhizobium sp. CAU 1741]|uniref:tripartite tricarboxylate transporter permease n=1 Tax=Mesorhizobium sp. CAU 1741 TaxID=3140366 RepID=UPI00325B9BB6